MRLKRNDSQISWLALWLGSAAAVPVIFLALRVWMWLDAAYPYSFRHGDMGFVILLVWLASVGVLFVVFGWIAGLSAAISPIEIEGGFSFWIAFGGPWFFMIFNAVVISTFNGDDSAWFKTLGCLCEAVLVVTLMVCFNVSQIASLRERILLQDEDDRVLAARAQQERDAERVREQAELVRKNQRAAELNAQRVAEAAEKARPEIKRAKRWAMIYRADNATVLDKLHRDGYLSLEWLRAQFERLDDSAGTDPAAAMKDALLLTRVLRDQSMIEAMESYRATFAHLMPSFSSVELSSLIKDISEPYLADRIGWNAASSAYSEILSMMKRMVDRNQPEFDAEQEAEHLDQLAKAFAEEDSEDDSVGTTFNVVRDDERNSA